jgi:hypothetical protein
MIEYSIPLMVLVSLPLLQALKPIAAAPNNAAEMILVVMFV